MKKAVLYLILLLTLQLNALTVRSIAHDDWSNATTWSNGQVPVSPDTIFIDHYVTLTSSLTINPPTVLFIEQSGTLCGDYFMDVACGAKWINYGSVFLGQLKVRDGWNYCTFTFKNWTIVTGCSLSGFGNGFSNLPPKGNVNISSFPSCRTLGTQWENGGSTGGGCTVGIKEYGDPEKMLVYPNPVNDKLKISAEGIKIDAVSVSDLTGRPVKYSGAVNEMDLSDVSDGIYILTMSAGSHSYVKRIIKN
ncbi:MAG: T9SS type A sorting domain-containing protein [Bacteroidia bacterium]